MTLISLVERNVNEKLKQNFDLLVQHIDILEELNFCMCSHNVLDIIQKNTLPNTTVLPLYETSQGFSRNFSPYLVSMASREYLFH